jgi:hypothetical protein
MSEKTILILIFFLNGMAFCQGQSQVKIDVLRSRHLTEFPSCSAVNYRDGRLYLIGDDAPNIYVLDHNYAIVDSLRISDHTGKRIPKKIKPDLEGSAIFTSGNRNYLVALGSASTRQRELVRTIPFAQGLDVKRDSTINTGIFINKLASKIDEVNLEGITTVGSYFILSNRANANHRINYLIVTSGPFWIGQNTISFHVLEVDLPIKPENAIGISDLCYDATYDRLFISFSTEVTASAYEDGRIGDSYLGFIQDFSKQMQASRIKVNYMINLSQVDTRFEKEKIEGLCVERVSKRKYLMHLTSDDDKGSSVIFKVKLRL